MRRIDPTAARAGGARAPGRASGFTLIELMVVAALVGAVLLLVPPRLDGMGARSRLESGANTISSALTAAREQSIIDGNPVLVEFDLEKGSYHYLVSTRKHKSPKELQSESARDEEEDDEEPEEEWIQTADTILPDDVKIAGFSVDREQWITSNPGGDPVRVTFHPDGSVRPAHAILLEGHPDLPDDRRFLTVTVNALTSLAAVSEGKVELPPKRPPSDFHQ